MARKTKFTKEQYELMPDDVKGLCVADGEDYVLEFETTADVAGLKSALDAEKKERAEKAKLLKAFEGLDPEAARKAVDDLRKAEEEKLKTAGQWDELKAQMRKEFEEKELNPAKQEAERYRKAAEKYLIESQFRAAVNKLEPHPGADDVLLPHFMQNVRLVEENGNLIARIYDGDHVKVDGKGEPVTFESFADTAYRQNEVFGHLFKPKGTAGSGAPAGNSNGNSNGSKTIQRSAFEALGPVERVSALKSGVTVID